MYCNFNVFPTFPAQVQAIVVFLEFIGLRDQNKFDFLNCGFKQNWSNDKTKVLR